MPEDKKKAYYIQAKMNPGVYCVYCGEILSCDYFHEDHSLLCENSDCALVGIQYKMPTVLLEPMDLFDSAKDLTEKINEKLAKKREK